MPAGPSRWAQTREPRNVPSLLTTYASYIAGRLGLSKGTVRAARPGMFSDVAVIVIFITRMNVYVCVSCVRADPDPYDRRRDSPGADEPRNIYHRVYRMRPSNLVYTLCRAAVARVMCKKTTQFHARYD